MAEINVDLGENDLSMKTMSRLLTGLWVMACVASASAALSGVSFVIGEHQFKTGDDIVIDQVLARAPKLRVGDKVTVRGHYRLGSTAAASLGLFVSHRSPAKADAAASSQTMRIEGANGTFELSCEITYAGDLHVSFYPASGGDAFGGVYFTLAPNHSAAPAPGAAP